MKSAQNHFVGKWNENDVQQLNNQQGKIEEKLSGPYVVKKKACYFKLSWHSHSAIW